MPAITTILIPERFNSAMLAAMIIENLAPGKTFIDAVQGALDWMKAQGIIR